ncbi:MAG: ABC transporter ATP-binding protein [Blautia sp.]|nr:ABC transporter ATP-binding protein [Blautia sp.]
MKKPIIEFHDFSWQYLAQSEPTLHNLNFTIREGEKILIAGPSGCGKSTMAHVINGLIPFSYRGEMKGEVRICGKKTSELSLFDISHMVGTVLQDSDAQFVGLTVAEDIAFALENENVPAKDLFPRVRHAAEEVGVEGVLHHAPSEISGGQKQRVSLAGVLAENVPILLFDEPLANLDPETGKQAVKMIDEIQKKRSVTVIIIEHRIEDVLYRDVDRILLLQEGRLQADLSPDKLLSSDLLLSAGIREPLYIAALKQAGVSIHADMHPRSMETIILSETDKEKVRSWFFSFVEQKDAAPSEELLECRDVCFAYEKGTQALQGITLTIRRGEMLAVVGTNGAGKSTFAKVICGFERQQEGTLFMTRRNGEKVSLMDLSVKERAEEIGYVMQNPNQMISRVVVFDETALGLRVRREAAKRAQKEGKLSETMKEYLSLEDEEIKRRTEDALRICGLYEMRNWPVSALSYGQKKRVTIASILVLDPEMIILDEPTAGQDYRHYTEIMDFLGKINNSGKTIVMVTHDMHLMLEYCTRAFVFSEGHLLRDDAPEIILTDPDVVRKASLRRTSLYDLSIMCGIDDAAGFVRVFVQKEQEKRVP